MIKFLKSLFSKKKTTPTINAIIVLTSEEAEKIAKQIPSSIIVSKVRNHVKKSGTIGLAGDISNSMR